jgi:hypothetical protein
MDEHFVILVSLTRRLPNKYDSHRLTWRHGHKRRIEPNQHELATHSSVDLVRHWQGNKNALRRCDSQLSYHGLAGLRAGIVEKSDPPIVLP